jgi:hypothetical protein
MVSKTQVQRIQNQQQWREHLQRHQASGQTVAEYAKGAGVSADALYYWRSRFQREGRMQDKPVTLTPVRVVEAVRPGAAVRVHLRNGVVVEWPAPLDGAGLSEVLRLAGALP